MKITVPRTSGFCYGVSLAVKEAEDILRSGKRLIMYGEIVHNPDVVGKLEQMGGKTVEDISEITEEDKKSGAVLLIRAHGVSRKVKQELVLTGLEIKDKTCPKVKKVHSIVSEEEEKGRSIVIVGDPKHPEVIGILGQCVGEAIVVGSTKDAEAAPIPENPSVVVQTTFNGHIFESIKKIILEKRSDAVIYNTMCPATNIRQQEIKALSENADAVIVFGGRKSSNSKKLCQIAGENAPSVIFEAPSELDLTFLEGKERVVVCGGSSTPYDLIRDAAEYIKDRFDAEIEYLK